MQNSSSNSSNKIVEKIAGNGEKEKEREEKNPIKFMMWLQNTFIMYYIILARKIFLYIACTPYTVRTLGYYTTQHSIFSCFTSNLNSNFYTQCKIKNEQKRTHDKHIQVLSLVRKMLASFLFLHFIGNYFLSCKVC